MVTAFLVSFGVIFVAELGDKSQLMALTFATRYRVVPVLIGITAATALVHAGVGARRAPRSARASRRTRSPSSPASRSSRSGSGRSGATSSPRTTNGARRPSRRGARVLTVGTVFFLAELGDKTMLATITLATRGGLFGTWLGSTLGMVARRRARDRRRSSARRAPAGTSRPDRRGGLFFAFGIPARRGGW